MKEAEGKGVRKREWKGSENVEGRRGVGVERRERGGRPEKYPEITIRHASSANKIPVDMSSKAK